MARLSRRFLTAALTLALVLWAQRLQPPVPILAAAQQPEYHRPESADTQQQPLPVTQSAHADEASALLNAPPLPQAPERSKRRPRVAIIIDDMGYNLDIGRQLLQLDLALSFSFLPAAPYTGELARQAQAGGRSILVHLPMEPKTWQGNEEQQTLRVEENKEVMQEQLKGMLAAVPAAVGANNHMGSRFTEDRQGMLLVLAQLQSRSMFYIDSFTSAASVGEITAQRMGLPTARRTVFLDNQPQVGTICRQLGLLAAKAEAEGQAIAIGHPNRAMVEALTSCAVEHLSGVQLVGVEALVR